MHSRYPHYMHLLSSRLLSLQLSKSKAVRLGNWERVPLSAKQLQYAATDAYISWRLHQVCGNCNIFATTLHVLEPECKDKPCLCLHLWITDDAGT